MNSSNIKRRYLDFRFGNQTLAPILQFSNFIMLSYLTIAEFISFYLFVPLAILSILVIYTLVGNKFRHYQVATDHNLNYEKATQAGMTVYEMMNMQKMIADFLKIKPTQSFLERLQYMKDIGENKK